MKTRTLLGIFFVATSGTVSAGGGVGVTENSGDAVICLQPDGTETVEMLDTYEARRPGRIPLDLGPGETYLEKVHYALDSLERLSPQRTAAYRKQADEFYSQIGFVSGGLGNLDDSDEPFLEPNCRLIQVARQNRNPNPAAPRYLVDRAIWNTLGVDGQAVLVLHEIVYNEAAREYGHESSRLARNFTATVATGGLRGMDPEAFIEFLKAVQFHRYEIYGLTAETLWSEGCRSRGPVQWGTSYYDDHLRIFDPVTGQRLSAVLACNTPIAFHGYTGRMAEYYGLRRHVFFHPDGSVRVINWNSTFGPLKIGGQPVELHPDYPEVEFYQTGEVRRATFKVAPARRSFTLGNGRIFDCRVDKSSLVLIFDTVGRSIDIPDPVCQPR